MVVVEIKEKNCNAVDSSTKRCTLPRDITVASLDETTIFSKTWPSRLQDWQINDILPKGACLTQTPISEVKGFRFGHSTNQSVKRCGTTSRQQLQILLNKSRYEIFSIQIRFLILRSGALCGTVRGGKRTRDPVSEHPVQIHICCRAAREDSTPSHYFTLQHALPPVCFPQQSNGLSCDTLPSPLVFHENTRGPSPPSISSPTDQRRRRYD